MMRKTTKIWLFVATSLVIIGLIMFVAVMSEYRWDFNKLNTTKYETDTREISKEFKSISINTDTANITFVLSDDGKCKVECYEEENSRHYVAVEEDTLVITVNEKKPWYDYIGINFGSPKITVYLPQSQYSILSIKEDTGDIELPEGFKFESIHISSSTGDVVCLADTSRLIKIKTSTGNINIENALAGNLDLLTSTGAITVSNVSCENDANIKVSTGKTTLTNLDCKNITSSGSTGDLFLNNVIAKEKFILKRSTGDVKFENSDARELFIETDTGNVVGNLLTDKIFIADTDTGRVDVPKTATGGRCEIYTDTGDIKINVSKINAKHFTSSKGSFVYNHCERSFDAHLKV